MLYEQIKSWLEKMHALRGSDLHLCAGSLPMIRVMGELCPCSETPLADDALREAFREIIPEAKIQIFRENHECDFRWELPGLGYYRVNFFETINGVAAAFREISCRIPSFGELGLEEQLKRLAFLPKGLVLITGPTGTGKSTTLAAIVNHANQQRRTHIITIEDPIEYVYSNVKSMVSQREVGTNTNTFASALRAALREDPDIIVVGEMRDLETTELCIQAAETGHLVFATLHTESAAQTIDRIINIFPGERQALIRMTLAQTISSILSVTLLNRADGSGRIQAMEIMHATPAVRNLIRDARVYQMQSILQTGHSIGMRTLDMHLAQLSRQGIITREAALLASANPQELAEQI